MASAHDGYSRVLEALFSARQHAAVVRAACDGERSLREGAEAWEQYLYMLDVVFERLQATLKPIRTAKALADSLKSRRKRVPELQYLMQARNASTHGIQPVTLAQEPRVSFGPADPRFPMMADRIVFSAEGVKEMTGFNVAVDHRRRSLLLEPVSNYGQWYRVPQRFDKIGVLRPLNAGEMADEGLRLIEQMVEETRLALRLPVPQSEWPLRS